MDRSIADRLCAGVAGLAAARGETRSGGGILVAAMTIACLVGPIGAGVAADRPDLQSLDVTRRRPLFSPTRRPPPELAAPPAVGEEPPVQQPAAAAAPPPDIKVSGIILGRDRSVAIVQGGQDAAPRQVSVGSEIDGWTVASIEVRQIELRRDSRSVQVALP